MNTIENLKKLKSIHNGSYGADIDEAIKSIELIRCLTDRPCSVCRFKTENGCNRWECVFKGGVNE